MTRTSDELVRDAKAAFQEASIAADKEALEKEIQDRHERQIRAAQAFRDYFDCEPTAIDDLGVVFQDIHFWWNDEREMLGFAKPCHWCGQPVYERSNYISRPGALVQLGEILSDPQASMHTDCEMKPGIPKRKTVEVPADQPMCTKKEREFLDLFEQLLAEGFQ